MPEPRRTIDVIATLTQRGHTLAVAESLTGGLLTAELTSIPGASRVVLGGIVAYATDLKSSLLDVDQTLLATEGPVHPEVARQLAWGVRHRLAVSGRPADIGIATTGVAGPTEQGGRSVGTVFLGVSSGESSRFVELALSGDREAIREETVRRAVFELAGELGL